MNTRPNLMVVLGPTASGKTAFAAKLAARTETEIISADSRQVYRGMDLGTGKDYDDYIVNGKQIPVHLIDVVDAGYKYNVYEYQRDFVKVFEEISRKEKVPVLCGGTGMYIEAVLKGYRLIEVPENQKLRKDLKGMNMAELERRLKSFKKLHNTTDITQKKRLIRAIEIEEYYQVHEQKDVNYPDIKPLIIGINVDRETRRSRITERLKKRLETGMVEEVKYLLGKDIDPDILIYYGLEYKFITMYLLGKLSYEEMFKRLETAIHQFAKRQMTWFRGMERRGYRIHWIDGLLPMDEKIRMVQEKLSLL